VLIGIVFLMHYVAAKKIARLATMTILAAYLDGSAK
jgi:hypothetical protein